MNTQTEVLVQPTLQQLRTLARRHNIEVFTMYGYEGEEVWVWQSCSPGCLPDADIGGIFRNEMDAYIDALAPFLDNGEHV